MEEIAELPTPKSYEEGVLEIISRTYPLGMLSLEDFLINIKIRYIADRVLAAYEARCKELNWSVNQRVVAALRAQHRPYEEQTSMRA